MESICVATFDIRESLLGLIDSCKEGTSGILEEYKAISEALKEMVHTIDDAVKKGTLARQASEYLEEVGEEA